MDVVNSQETTEETLLRKLQELTTNSDPVELIRQLLLLSNSKHGKIVTDQVSLRLSVEITKSNGLLNLIEAVIDSDETSQKNTTLQQRFVAVGTIVAFMPKLSFSLVEYYKQIAPQVILLLRLKGKDDSHSEKVPHDIQWKIGASILISLLRRNKKLTNGLIIRPVFDCIQCRESDISVSEGIEILHRLVVCKYDVANMLDIVPNLYYLRITLEGSPSHLKKLLDEILGDVFSSMDRSAYILDSLLFNSTHLLESYEIGIDGDTIGPQIKDGSNTDSLREIEKVDRITVVTSNIFGEMKEEQKIDFFLLLLERLNETETNASFTKFILIILIGSIEDKVNDILIKYPAKSIQFAVKTLNRLSRVVIEPTSILEQILESDNCCAPTQAQTDQHNMESMQQDSLTMSLQIIRVLLQEQDKLKPVDVMELRECIPYLKRIVSARHKYDESVVNSAQCLVSQVESLSELSLLNCYDSAEGFEKAVKDLNSPLMPDRAHGLICLKRLISCKDAATIRNEVQLINILKSSLNDMDSYIYLAAISALASLAITSTSTVLPILISSFEDSARTLQERISIGQVMVNVSKSLGDIAGVYAPVLVNCFIIGTKSDETIIRISSLSNLGQLCGTLKFALAPYIIEIWHCVQCLIKTDPSVEVKRACVMLVHLMLDGIDKNSIDVIRDDISSIYRIMKHVHATSLDDILQLHAQLAVEQLNRIAKEMLTFECPTGTRKIHMYS